MSRFFGTGRLRIVALMFVVVSGSLPRAQSVPLPDLKAAFLFNFARFAEWPANLLPPGSSLVLCVAGDEAVGDALEQTVRGRSVNGRDLAVRRVNPDGAPPACHLYYVGGTDRSPSQSQLPKLNATWPGVFTVGEARGFAQAGGIAELFLEDGRLKIAVNIDALHRANLRLSSRVLGLAKLVKDAPAP